MNPISCEPLSPIHTSARRPGRRLKGRKAISATASEMDITSTSREG